MLKNLPSLVPEDLNMPVPIVAGNWKMNTTLESAVELVKTMRNDLDGIHGVEKILCPPYISIAEIRKLIERSSIKLGAQNMYFEEKGAFTGEISSLMLKSLCEYVIIGHSERRQYFGESDDLVNKKVRAALHTGLTPILCVGEKLEQREKGQMESIITGQVNAALQAINSIGQLIIAYEPIWAIGTGRAATGEQANIVNRIIRAIISKLYGDKVAQNISILYGGSVTDSNIKEFINQSDVNGTLVGGASLKAADFLSIAQQTAEIKKAG
jgi:triosephosphate isomerase